MYRLLSWLSSRRIPRQLASAVLPETAKGRLWAASHDMYEDASEQFYGEIYMSHILNIIHKHLRGDKIRVIDLGCGHGRLAIKLAKHGYNVVAIEKNETALKRAIKHAAMEKVTIDFQKTDVLTGREWGLFDLVTAMEPLRVNGSRSEVEKLIPIVQKNLRPGGIAVLSVRTRYYNVARAIMQGDLVEAQKIADGNDAIGWLTPAELESMLNGAGFESVEIIGIGTVSGLKGDPLGSISVPDEFPRNKRKLLEDIEIEMGTMNEVAGCGRYMLAFARKPAT